MIAANAEEIKKMDGIAEEHTQQLIQRISHVMTLKKMIDEEIVEMIYYVGVCKWVLPQISLFLSHASEIRKGR